MDLETSAREDDRKGPTADSIMAREGMNESVHLLVEVSIGNESFSFD